MSNEDKKTEDGRGEKRKLGEDEEKRKNNRRETRNGKRGTGIEI